MTSALVIGAGPAGLMAATMLADAGCTVTIADAMPSAGRKFLMAGKSGLNLTKDEPDDKFVQNIAPAHPTLKRALASFGPANVKAWATGLGQEVFTGTTGRVFPKAMKASPLLRAWLADLGSKDVRILTKHRWAGWDADGATFTTPQGPITLSSDVTVLALGGASWSRLGSDGAWANLLPDVVPFAPSNAGVTVDWSPHMAKFFGAPVKAVALTAGNTISRGEWVITEKGIEGGGIYTLTPQLRAGETVYLDLRPDWSLEKVANALARKQGKTSLNNHLRKALRLSPVHIALLREAGGTLAGDIAGLVKRCALPITGLAPMDAAISTAGGVSWDSLDDTLMLRHSAQVGR